MEPLSEQPYDSEPSRPELLVASSEPFNGEPPLSRLVKQYVTPTELFFVRNHSAVPSLDVTQHCVVLNGPGFLEQELSFSVADLFKFEQHTVT
jgi:sulfite oxidase